MAVAAFKGYVGVLEAFKPWPYNVTRAFYAAAACGHVRVLELECNYSSGILSAFSGSKKR